MRNAKNENRKSVVGGGGMLVHSQIRRGCRRLRRSSGLLTVKVLQLKILALPPRALMMLLVMRAPAWAIPENLPKTGPGQLVVQSLRCRFIQVESTYTYICVTSIYVETQAAGILSTCW